MQYIPYIVGAIVMLIYITYYMNKVSKKAEEDRQINQDILSELKKHTDLLEKLISESSDEEKAELAEKLKQVSEILKNN